VQKQANKQTLNSVEGLGRQGRWGHTACSWKDIKFLITIPLTDNVWKVGTTSSFWFLLLLLLFLTFPKSHPTLTDKVSIMKDCWLNK
jgi:hypothetical protein